jgi:hypothetical protein
MTPPTRLWRDGAALVIRRNAALPTGRCLRCQNAAAGVAPIPGPEKASFRVALCAGHMRWIRFGPAAGYALAIAGLIVLVTGGGRGSVPLALVGFYLLLVSVVCAAMARGTLKTIGANTHFIRVSGVSVRYLQTLHGWNDYPQPSA